MPIDRTATLRSAERLVRQGRLEAAIAEYLRAVEDKPDDWATTNTLGDLYVRAGQVDKAVERFTQSADRLAAQGFLPKAGALYKKVLKLRPDHQHALLGAAEMAAGQGLLADARGFLTDAGAVPGGGFGSITVDDPAEVDDVRAIAEYPDPAAGRDDDDDPELMLAAAELQIRADCPDQGLALVNRLLERHPGRHEHVAELGWTVADAGSEVGFAIVDLAARTAVGLGDLPSAAAALQEFVTRVPTHIPALVRLVETCVEGGLEAATYNARAQLADAYIAAGLGAQAHVIAEGLAACEPWEPLHVERLRRAIELAGAPGRDGRSRSGAGRFDLARIAGKTIDAPDGPVHDSADGGEIDLGPGLDREEDGPPTKASLTSRDEDPERVSARRRSAAGEPAPDMAGEMYRLGLALREAGDIDAAIEALEAAAPAPGWRFACASLLGRLFRERGMTRQAVEWYERAAEWRGASAADTHELLYELAEALEEHGEIGRALAVCLELKAEAGAYRDVARRIAWLTKVQARG